MKKLKRQSIFTVRIVYKSGYTHDFDCVEFEINKGTYTWTSVDNNNKPIDIGVNEIAAVYQVGTHKEWKWV
jgi:hypothetical protein